MGYYDELGTYYPDQGEDNSGGGTGSSDWSAPNTGGFNLGGFFDAAANAVSNYSSQLPAPANSSYQNDSGFNWQQPLWQQQDTTPPPDYSSNYGSGFGSSDWGNSSGSNWFQNLNLPGLFADSTPAQDQGFNFPNFGQSNNYGFPSMNSWASPGQMQKQQADQLFAAPGAATDWAASSDSFLSGPAQTTRNLWQNSVDPLLGFTPSVVGDISQGRLPGVFEGAARTLFDGTNYAQEMQTKKQQATNEMYDAVYKASGGNIDQANQAAQHLDAYLNPVNLAEYNGLEDFQRLPGPVRAAVTMGDPVLMGGLAYLSKLKGVRPVAGEAPQMLHSEAPKMPELEGAGTQIAPGTGSAQALPDVDYFNRQGYLKNLQDAIFQSGNRPSNLQQVEANRLSLLKNSGGSVDDYLRAVADAAQRDGLSLDDLWKAAGQTRPAPSAPPTPAQVQPLPTAVQPEVEAVAAPRPAPLEPLPFRRPNEPLPIKPRPGREVETPRPIAAELPEEVSTEVPQVEPTIEEGTPDYTRPFWQSPYFYLPAGAAAFGVGYGGGAIQDALRQPPAQAQNTLTSPTLYPSTTSASSLPPPTTPPAKPVTNSNKQTKPSQPQEPAPPLSQQLAQKWDLENLMIQLRQEGNHKAATQIYNSPQYQQAKKAQQAFYQDMSPFARQVFQQAANTRAAQFAPAYFGGASGPLEGITAIQERLRRPGGSYSFALPLPSPQAQPYNPVIVPPPAPVIRQTTPTPVIKVAPPEPDLPQLPPVRGKALVRKRKDVL